MKNIYVVLNPPRCGSSCTARALQAVGIDLGTNLMAPAKFNEKGFFEDNDIRAINHKLRVYLQRVQQGEKDLNPMNSDIFTTACELLKNRTANKNYFGFKDPVTIKFLPFWQEVFKTLELTEHYIIAIRNPQCYGHSALNMFRGRMSHIEKSFLTWLNHVYPAIEKTQGKPTIVVDYDENLANPAGLLKRLSDFFDLSKLYNEESYNKYCNDFIDSNLQHHKYTLEDLEKNSSVFPICVKIYRVLLKAAQDKYSLEDANFKTDWVPIQKHINENRTLYRYIEALAQHYDNALIKSNQLENSLSWRMTKPFRKVRSLFKRKRPVHPLSIATNHK